MCAAWRDGKGLSIDEMIDMGIMNDDQDLCLSRDLRFSKIEFVILSVVGSMLRAYANVVVNWHSGQSVATVSRGHQSKVHISTCQGWIIKVQAQQPAL